MKPAQWIGAALGMVLMVSPATFGYVETTAGDVHRTIGPLIVACSLVAAWSVTRDVRWANLVLAAALVAVAALPIGTQPVDARLVAVVTGLAVAAATPFGGPDAQRRGRGWRGVVRRTEGVEACPRSS